MNESAAALDRADLARPRRTGVWRAAALFCFAAFAAIACGLIAPLQAGAMPPPLDDQALQRFYEARGNKAAWTGESDATRASWVRAVLLGADAEGLDPEDYHAREIAGAAGRIAWESPSRYELLLTDGLLRFARDVRLGRVAPASVDGDTDLPQQTFDAAAALQTALDSNSLRAFLADLPPPHPEYAALRAELARLRGIAAEGGFPSVPDASGPMSAALMARLKADEPALDEARFAANRAYAGEALMEFQRRNGLDPDGKLTAPTLEALNRPVGDRIRQIEANMERWRWLPRSLGESFIAVNVPDATLSYVRGGRKVLTSRVVIGRPGDRTPIFHALATGLTLNPSWDVPTSIARREILPALRRDPHYLARQRIVIVNGPPGDPFGESILWPKVSASEFAYRLRQLPGADNALGNLKLEMPNRFDVYLHDTPNRDAFGRVDRDISHGCLRVERIKELASIALDIGPETGLYAVGEIIKSGETRSLPLPAPLPVYILYWTAFAGESGHIEYRRDIYGRDARLLAALANRRLAAGTARLQTCAPR